MISLMTPLTHCPLCECQLHNGVCWMCDGTIPMHGTDCTQLAPARPSLADLFAEATDHEEAMTHLWATDKFAARVADTFPSIWDHPAISDSQILGHQWHFAYAGLDVAVTWDTWPERRWIFQAWDSETEIACDTSDGYLSQPDGALLVFLGAAVIATMTDENEMKEAA